MGKSTHDANTDFSSARGRRGRLLAADNGNAGAGPSEHEMLYGAAERAIRVVLNKEFSLNNPKFLSGA
jgi:hypothetical protein